MSSRLTSLGLFIFLLQPLAYAQQSEPINFFYEIIQDDSILMFFNKRDRFIDKPCADYFRFTRVDNGGNFNGYFEDFTKDSLLRGRGYYVHGARHGYFETFHPGGKIKSKELYDRNIPVGSWEYFYENGLPERTLKFTSTDTLLIRFVDKDGNITVSEGNGDFNGLVAGLSKPSSQSIVAKGKIINGKPHGKWSSTFAGYTYCKEEFNYGKLIEGSFPNARFDKPYRDKSFLNTFLPGNYFELLEKFRTERCADSSKYSPPKEKYTFDIKKFSSDLRPRIDRIIESDFRTKNAQDYSVGDLYLTIQFTIDKEGKPDRFSLLGGWGQQYFSTITNSVKNFAKFPPHQSPMYFHLKISIPGGFIYHYNFTFSKERANTL